MHTCAYVHTHAYVQILCTYLVHGHRSSMLKQVHMQTCIYICKCNIHYACTQILHALFTKLSFALLDRVIIETSTHADMHLHMQMQYILCVHTDLPRSLRQAIFRSSRLGHNRNHRRGRSRSRSADVVCGRQM